MANLATSRRVRWICLLGGLLVLTVLNRPGCLRRSFPPMRDPHFYTLEVYLVRVPSHFGSNHPEIADVITHWRTKLLKRFPVVMLGVGETSRYESQEGSQDAGILAYFDQKKNGLALFTIQVKGPMGLKGLDAGWVTYHVTLPCDTWGTVPVQVDSEDRTVSGLVYRLNSPMASYAQGREGS